MNMKPRGSLTSPRTQLAWEQIATGQGARLRYLISWKPQREEDLENCPESTGRQTETRCPLAILRASGRCCSGFGLRPRPTSSPSVFPKELTLLGWKCSWRGDFENPDCQLGRHAPLRRSSAYFSGFLWKPSPAPALRHSPPCELLQEADVLTSAFGQRLTLDKCRQEGKKVLTRMNRWQDSI